MPMKFLVLLSAPVLAAIPTVSAVHAAPVPQPVSTADGIIRLKSANGFDDTVTRLKADVAAKGIRLFDQIDQSGLGAQADLKIGRSTLVIFGNPPLGVQFLQSNQIGRAHV